MSGSGIFLDAIQSIILGRSPVQVNSTPTPQPDIDVHTQAHGEVEHNSTSETSHQIPSTHALDAPGESRHCVKNLPLVQQLDQDTLSEAGKRVDCQFNSRNDHNAGTCSITSEEDDEDTSGFVEENAAAFDDECRQQFYSGYAMQITAIDPGMLYGLVEKEYRFSLTKFTGFCLYDKVDIKAVKEPDSIEWIIVEMDLHKSHRIRAIEERQKYAVSSRKVKAIDHGHIELWAVEIGATESSNIPDPKLDYKLIPGDWLEIKTKDETSGSFSRLAYGKMMVDLWEKYELRGKVTGHVLARLNQDDYRECAVVEGWCLIPPWIVGNLELNPGLPVTATYFRSYQEDVFDRKNKKIEFKFRAVSIREDLIGFSQMAKSRSERLCMDKNGISVHPKIFLNFGVLKLGSSKEASFRLNNFSYDHTHMLQKIEVQSDQTVGKFTPIYRPESEDIIAVFPARDQRSVEIKIQCETKALGDTTELCIFHFKDFQICKELKVKVIPGEKDLVEDLTKNRVTLSKHRRTYSAERQEIVKRHAPFAAPERDFVNAGIPAVRKAFFMETIPEKTKSYPIPKSILDAAAADTAAIIFKNFPSLAATEKELANLTVRKLTPENYTEMFHVSLWLEELHHLECRQKYNIGSIEFNKSGDTFFFEFPGLDDIYPKLLKMDPIQFCDANSPEGRIFKTTISGFGPSRVFFNLQPDLLNEYDGRPLAVEFLIGRTSYKRNHNAIDKIVENMGLSWLFPTNYQCIEPRVTFIEDTKDIEAPEEARNPLTFIGFRRSGIHSRKKSGRTGSKRNPSVRAPKHPHDELVRESETAADLHLRWANKKLNAEQKRAIRMILRGQARPTPYVIFGPPGTGKTVTVVEAVIQIRRLYPKSRVLVCAPSNAAANQIGLYLMEFGEYKPGEFVRLVGFTQAENTIPELLQKYCCDGEEIENVYTQRIIITTCNTSAQFLETYGILDGWCTHVFIDEAGYCHEPDSVIPCLLVSKNTDPAQVILAGDPKQLGPVIFDHKAFFYGLSLSFLERLMDNPLYKRSQTDGKYNPLLLTKLVRNYRAHPNLLALPSKLFYDNELISASVENLDELCHTLPFLPKRGVPLLFHGIRGEQSRDLDSPSWYNHVEVIQVVQYVKNLLENHCSSDDIGIITPYRKQVEKIREALEKEVRCRPIRVGSVEEFQGGEKSIVILSLVRSISRDDNEDKMLELKFAFHPKRFNVCLTRAKSLLIAIGDPHVFVSEFVWREFIKYCIVKGVYCGCNLPPVLQIYLDRCKGKEIQMDFKCENSESDEDEVKKPLVKEYQYDVGDSFKEEEDSISNFSEDSE